VNESPALYRYLKKYQENPQSRVFAPLAEAYRKAGLAKEAEEIAREGLGKHPRFVGGQVALARALFDQGKYQEVVDLLQRVVSDIPDNLAAQKLLGESYLLLGNTVMALGAYKMLLYFQPGDAELATVVQELEEKVLKSNPVVEPENFNIGQINSVIMDDQKEKEFQWKSKVKVLQKLLQNIERNRSDLR